MKVPLPMRLIGGLLVLAGLATWYCVASDPERTSTGAGESDLTAVVLSPVPEQGEETIDPQSGRLELTTTDVIVPAGPLSLEMKRCWQNQPTGSGLLGSRWRLNWETRLRRQGSQVVIDEWQGTVTFTIDPAVGAYQAASGDRLMIAADRAVRILPDGTRETFDARGLLIERHLPGGHKITLTHDGQGRLATISGPYGSFLRLTSNSQGRLTRIDASTGAVVRYGYGRQKLAASADGQELVLGYGYDENGMLTHVDHPNRGRTTFRHLGERIVNRRWADGSQEKFDYDDAGRCRRHVDAAGRLTTMRWITSATMEAIDSLNRKTLVENDSTGKPVQITGPTGQSARFTYDQRGRMVSAQNSFGKTTHLEYLGNTQLPVKLTAADGTRQTFEYDTRHNLLRITEGDTVAASFSYDAGGLVTRLKTSRGLDLSFTYDEHGWKQSVADAAGKTTRFEYDRQGNRIREINPLGGVTQRTYDTAGRLVRLIDPAGGITRFEYSPSGLLSRRTEPAGGVTSYEYDARGRRMAETDPDGRSRRYEYSPDGALKRIVGGIGTSAQLDYDRGGNLARWTNPLGGVTRADYDPLGRLSRLTDPAGGVTGYEYSPAGLLTRRTDPAGTVTRYDYDAKGRLATITGPTGQVTRYEYSPHGHLARIIPARGPVTAYEYNQAGKVVRVVGRQGELVRYEYDVLGRRVKEHHAAGRTVAYRYDDVGNLVGWNDNFGGGGSLKYDPVQRPVSVTDGAGASTHYRYDPAGRLLESTNPLGHSKRLAYSPGGRLVLVREPTGDESRLEYDLGGRLEKLHHAGGGLTRLARDRMGNLLRETNPLGHETLRTYDLAGRLTSITDAKGQTASFSYDPAGRLLEKLTADGTRVRYRYDAQGNRTAVDDGKFPVLFSYDKHNQLARIEYPAIRRNLRYEYNASGQRTKLVDSEGRTIGYEHDATGRLSAITLDQVKTAAFAYDAKNRLTSMTYANGVKGVREYDANSRLTRLTYASADGQVIAGWFYSYDAAGNCIKSMDVTGGTARYSHDPAGQLLEEDHGDGKAVKYSYFAGGNRSQREGTEETTSYRYDKADRLLAAGQETFNHDANGNLIERRSPEGVTRYAYDAENRLIKVVTPGGAEVAFGYAPTGQRIWRRDAKGLTYFVHDGLALTAELDQDLKPKATYLHGAGIDRPLAMDQGGRQYYYHAGRLGSIHRLTDAKGQSVAAYDYDAFGTLRRQEGSIASPFAYTAREFDPAIGLYYYRARYYDARLGRFLTTDPMPPRLLQPLTANPYLYVRNNPVNLVDPLGLAEENWASADWNPIFDYFNEFRKTDPDTVQAGENWGNDVNRWQGWPDRPPPDVVRQQLQVVQERIAELQSPEYQAYLAEVESRIANSSADSEFLLQRIRQMNERRGQWNFEAELDVLRQEEARLLGNLRPGARPPASGTPPPNRPLPPPRSNMPASNWVDESTRTSTNLPRVSEGNGGRAGTGTPEGNGIGEYLAENGPRIASVITAGDLIVHAANGADPAQMVRVGVTGLVANTLLQTLPAGVGGPLSAVMLLPAIRNIFTAGARGYGQVFTEARQQINDWQSRSGEEKKRAAQQQVLRGTRFDSDIASLNAEADRLLGLKDQLVADQADLQNQKQNVLRAAIPDPDPNFDAKRGQTLGKIRELEELIASTVGVTDQMRSKRQEAIQARRAAEDAQRALAATANAAKGELDILTVEQEATENSRNDLDRAVETLRRKIEISQGAYDQNDARVKSAFDTLFAKLRLITDVTAVDIRQPLNEAKAVERRARSREEYAQQSLKDLPPIPDLPEDSNAGEGNNPPSVPPETDPADGTVPPTSRTAPPISPPVSRTAPPVSRPTPSKNQAIPKKGRSTTPPSQERSKKSTRRVPEPKETPKRTVRNQNPPPSKEVAKRKTAPKVTAPKSSRPQGSTGPVVTKKSQTRAPQMVIAPQLVGQTFDQAKKMLSQQGLLWSPGLGVAGARPTDIVSRQEPAAGARVRSGGMVVLHVRNRRR